MKTWRVSYILYLITSNACELQRCDTASFGTQFQHSWDEGGRVLIHCSRGVSRSCAFCIAFLMWRNVSGLKEACGDSAFSLQSVYFLCLHLFSAQLLATFKVQLRSRSSPSLSAEYRIHGAIDRMGWETLPQLDHK